MHKISILVSRHSAFYSPLISTISGGFLEREGLEATYGAIQPGQNSRPLLRSGAAEVMQSAVGSRWGPLERGETDLPVHFAQINRRDGFFLAIRAGALISDWKDPEGRRLLDDHGDPAPLYEQALEVFEAGGAVQKRHPYESVAAPPPVGLE